MIVFLLLLAVTVLAVATATEGRRVFYRGHHTGAYLANATVTAVTPRRIDAGVWL